MAFNIGAIPFNQSSGVGEGLNAAAQNFLRAYQLGKERKLREQQAATQQQQAGLQTQAMQREAAMAPLREALIRGQAFQQGIKPAEQAAGTQFNLPTMPGTPGTLGLSSLPALTVSRDQRYVPLGGGRLPISDVSDATQASVPEEGGFVFDTMDNPVARERNDQERQLQAQREATMAAARQQLQMLFTREGLAGQRQQAQRQFTASQNDLNRTSRASESALNRANQRTVAETRSRATAARAVKPTEFNNKAALVAPRAAEADQLIDQLGNPEVSIFMRGAQAVPILGQFALNDDQQQLQQAGEVLATAILRLESGAAVSEQEAERYAKQFIPQPGDSDDLLQQKARLRDIAVQRLQAAAGPALARQRSRYSPDNPFAPRPQ